LYYGLTFKFVKSDCLWCKPVGNKIN
jgi:hypothetical protein